MPTGPLTRRALVAAVLTLPVLAASAGVADASRVTALSRHAIPASSAWKRDVVDPGRLVYPRRVRVIGAASGVSHPDGLKAAGGASTTITATGAGAPRLVLDLGANTGGHVEVGITRADGTKVQLGYSELRRFLTPRGDNCGCGQLGFSVGVDDTPDGRSDVIDAAGPTTWSSPGIRGAERYVALQLQGAGSVSIDYVRVRVTHLRAPVSAYAGHFLSSDRTLNRAWYASAYTFAMDAFRDLRPAVRAHSRTVVTDGAKRDRLIWAGDLAIENQLGAYSLRPARRIIRNSLEAFSCQQLADGEIPAFSFIATRCPEDAPAAPPSGTSAFPEYTAWWVVGLHDYELYSGDGAFARGLLPVVRRAIAYYLGRRSHGLYVTPATGQNWHPPDIGAGVDAHTNAVVFRALRDAADLERRLGTNADARRDLRAARTLRRALVARMWDAKAGAFVGNSADRRRNHTQDAQVEAVLDGMIGRARSRRALHFLSTHLATRLGTANGQYDDDPYMSNYVSPYISSTELLARLQTGDPRGALRLIRRAWGYMLKAGPGTLWEKIGFGGLPANYEPLQKPRPFFDGNLAAGWTSLAHGWGGGPVPALSGYVLGIRPASAGFRRWIVAPQPGGLRLAQGQAPTPHGPVVSRWRRGPRSFRLTVAGPHGTAGTVEIPTLGHRRAIAMDGRIVWDGRRARRGIQGRAVRGAVAFRGLRGRHTFAWARRA